MAFIWNPAKARENARKHGVRFQDIGEQFFAADSTWSGEDELAEGEQRWKAIGFDAIGELVVVIYTLRSDAVRLISARKANRREQHEFRDRF